MNTIQPVRPRAALVSLCLLLALLLSACARATPPPATPTDPPPEPSPTSTPLPAIPTPPAEIAPVMTELPVVVPFQLAPWQSISPAISIYALAIDPFTPDTLYIGADGGVMKSLDRGMSWGLASQGLTDPNVVSLTVDPSSPGLLYAGTRFDGVFKSTDGAASWVPINAGMLDQYPIQALVLDPRSPGTLYAGTYEGGAYKTVDGGNTWRAANTGLLDLIVDELLIDPTNPAILYAGTRTAGLFKTTDGAVSWSAANEGLNPASLSIASLALDPYSPSTLYMGDSYGSVYKSSDGAASWTQVASSLAKGAIAGLVVSAQQPSSLYAAAWDAGVFSSRDGGLSWFPVYDGLPAYPIQVLALDPLRPTNLYAGTLDGGLFAMLADTTNIQMAQPVPAPTEIAPTKVPAPVAGGWRGAAASLAADLQQSAPLVGMTLAIHRLGEPDWAEGFGYANWELSIPATPDTVYPIGGLSMQFTAAAVMQLVEMGLLDLNTPIGMYVVGLPGELQSATLHQLLSHTSGIDDSLDTLELYTSPGFFTSQDLLQTLVPTFVLRDASESSGGYAEYILAGLVIEAVTGLSYADYVNQNIIQRAGLLRTAYCLPPPGNLAQGYYLPEGTIQTIQLNASALFAAGGLCSTATDLLQWNTALASGRVVSPASYRQMLTAVQTEGSSDLNSGYGLYFGQTPYGLMVLSYGGMAGSNSLLVSYPGNGVDIALLSNTANGESNVFELVEALTPLLTP